jgi:acetyltransferase-like isoleucine patch superfamily enzyme
MELSPALPQLHFTHVMIALLRRILQGICSRLRAATLRICGARIEGHVWLRGIEWPARPGCITLGKGAALDRSVTLLATRDEARIKIGAQSYLNRHTMIDASERVEIGDCAMIGPFCYITDHDHSPDDAQHGALVSEPTILGGKCWLGAHVCVLKGVTIGEGAVVGAGSVVTKSLPPRVLAAGSPARILRSLDEQT